MLSKILHDSLFPALCIWLIATLFGLVPPFSRDALNDHLMLPLLWQQHGLFWRDSTLFITAYPPLADLPYTLFANMPWDWAASIWHASGALVALFFLRQAMRNMHIDETSIRIALLAWACTPVVVSLCTWTYVDLWLCAVVSAMAERLTRAQWQSRDAWLFGFLLGVAALIKYNGIPIAIAGIIAMAWRWRHHKYVWKWGLLSISTTFITAGWWYIGNQLTLGHALYPIGASRHMDIPWLQYRELAYHENIFWALLSPLRQFFWGQVNQPQLFDGMLHPLWLAGIFALLRMHKSPRVSALAMVVFIYALFALSTAVRARYWLPGMTMLIPLLGLTLMHAHKQRWKALIIASFIPTLIASFIYLAALSPWVYWSQGREAFLQDRVPGYALMHWVSEYLPKQASVYLLWVGGKAYYLHRHYHSSISNVDNEVRKMLVRNHITPQSYLLMNRKLANLTVGEDMHKPWQYMLDCSTRIAKQNTFELWKIGLCNTSEVK